MSLPSPSTNGIESAAKAGPPVTAMLWPDGVVESSRTSRRVVLSFAGVQASAAVTVCVKSPVAALVQLNALET